MIKDLDMLTCFKIIKERIKKNDYNRIQYLPLNRSLIVGRREFYIFKSFFYQKTPCIFHSTGFYTLYHFIFKKKYPLAYNIYKIFFMNETFDKESLHELFSPNEIDNFIKNDIIKYKANAYKLNFRFIPIGDLFLIGKVYMNNAEYAHVGEDSLILNEFLRKKIFVGANYKRALEIGCGAGLLSVELAMNANIVDAVDINPYAVKVADLNAKLNNISNLHTFSSDCYQNVKEKYDLIISNPPFVIMPEKYKNEFHSYGGFLGIEITSKIFKGLDQYLKDNGEAIILTPSHIRNFRIDPIKNAIEKIFNNKNFKITLFILDYQILIDPDYYSVYREYNITHSITYIISIKRANNFQMIIIPLTFFKKIKALLRLAFFYIIIFLRKSKG